MGGGEAGAPGPDPHAAAGRVSPDREPPPAPLSPRPERSSDPSDVPSYVMVDRGPESRCWCIVNLIFLFFDAQRKFYIVFLNDIS